MSSSIERPNSLIPDAVTRTMIYFGGPFFAYPFKPLWNRYEGAPYHVALKHFRRDHMTNENLFLHFLCLIGQLGSNFGLLSEFDKAAKKYLDEYFGIVIRDDGIGPISSLTAVAWVYELLKTPAPLPVKALSTISIYLAYKNRTVLPDNWERLIQAQAIIEITGIHLLIKRNGLFDMKGFVSVLVARLALGELVKRYQGSLKSKDGSYSTFLRAMIVLQFALSAKPPVFVAPFVFGIYGWILARLTDEKWVYLWSMSYLASLSQGIAHNLSKEPPTLPQLQKVSDELAHTVFFPNILYQSILQNLKNEL